ncbi:MAG: hypothetical protein KY464_18990 [Gemmatimonadetes bacterium]|nr:hypothetical protein [Gemmatimonadota bacterium]
MRGIYLVLLPCLAACGGGSLTLEGTLADSTAAGEVWAMGRAERITVENGAFRLQDVEGDTIELRFTAGGDSQVRMLLHDLPDGGTLRLEGIWFADEVAFPTRVGGAAAPTVVNGLRMARGDVVPRDVNLPGTVLAVADDGDALVLRPADAALPDLNVLITPASVVHTADGDLVEADQLQFGDTLRVSGIGEGGHVIAAEILVSRRVASNDDEASNEVRQSNDPYAPAPAARPASLVRQAPVDPPEDPGKGRGKGTGKEKSRGKGKGRD